MSTERFQRIIWVVLDGVGIEHARRFLASRRFPALARIEKEGRLGAIQPASPVCQTPPALLALFAGTEPAENGVWGYNMPDPRRLESTISGFFAEPRQLHPLWQDLEERGIGYSLINVAFRNDPVWKGSAGRLVFGFDGYRLWRKPESIKLDGRASCFDFRGIDLRVVSHHNHVDIMKGNRFLAKLPLGQGQMISPTRGTRAFAHLFDQSTLLLYPVTPPVVRGETSELAAESPDINGFLDMNAFWAARRAHERQTVGEPFPIASALHPSEVSFRRKADLMRAAARNRAAKLVVGYFPVIDELNHPWFDLFESEAGDGAAARLFAGAFAPVDEFLSRLMEEADEGTLLVVSSDHGAASYRRLLHVNELFADAGLVKRVPDGYDLRRSSAYYHPSDCGQVVVNEHTARSQGFDSASLRAAVAQVVERANRRFSAQIALLGGGSRDPFLAFLYPMSDTYFTGDPPRRGRAAIDPGKSGGHHLSQLSPTPWIQAMIGLWSPGTAARSLHVPQANKELKRFLLDLLPSSR